MGSANRRSTSAGPFRLAGRVLGHRRQMWWCTSLLCSPLRDRSKGDNEGDWHPSKSSWSGSTDDVLFPFIDAFMRSAPSPHRTRCYPDQPPCIKLRTSTFASPHRRPTNLVHGLKNRAEQVVTEWRPHWRPIDRRSTRIAYP